MNFTKMVLGVSLFAMTAIIPAMAANAPQYNPATAVSVEGIVTAVHNVPAGQSLEGVHLTVKLRTGMVEVYVGPAGFLKFLKTSFAVGEGIDVMGSKVKDGNTDLILAREVNDGTADTILRDVMGAPVWQNWGVEADPSSVQQ